MTDENQDDGALMLELRDSLAAVSTPEPPPLAMITQRGHVHQRRRRTRLAGFGVAVAAAGVVLGLG